MPEAVAVWAEEMDVAEMEQVQSAILRSYEYDFGKHAPKELVQRINLIWNSIPSQLARENEMDFVLEKDNRIYPIEVKAGVSVKSASLKKYRTRFEEATPLAIRFSLKNLSLDDHVLNIPLFLADRLPQLLPDITMR